MRKFWLVSLHEYFRHVLRKRFIFALLSLPFFILISVGIGILAVAAQYNPRPVGFVDYAGVIKATDYNQNAGSGIFSTAQFISFPDEKGAQQALAQKKVQAYYIIEADYMKSGRARLVSNDPPGENTRNGFRNLMRYNLVANQPPAIVNRLLDGTNLEVHSFDGSRELTSTNWLGIVFPILSGILFIVVVNTSGGYLMQAVVEEKENRTMEIVVTSVSPTQLMAGKIVGNLSVGLTQLLIWVLFPLIGFVLARQYIPQVKALTLDTQFLWLMLLTLLPAFVFVAALMATIGSTATESREAQQVAGLFTLPIAVPFWFFGPIMTNPNGPLAVGMSLFPLTAPVTLPLRAAFSVIPLWQEAVSIGLLVAVAIGAVWLAGRAFRLGMLRYGKPLSWKELFQKA